MEDISDRKIEAAKCVQKEPKLSQTLFHCECEFPLYPMYPTPPAAPVAAATMPNSSCTILNLIGLINYYAS
ncbi:hypothetical protein HanHA89_Chr03g0113771 [Helianthus annuus]|nr:hypothetical protein HanHA89_Chr03g0113771 [Helianthus annuus]